MKWLVLVMVSACATSPKQTATTKDEIAESASSDFFAAVARKDVAALHKFVGEPFDYGGLWFPTPDCQRRFPVARRIGQELLSDFAACLATLPLRESTRHDGLYGVSVATYDPGIEIEIAFAYQHDGSSITWIGFEGRRARNDGIPTVTPAALASLLVTGDRVPATTPETDAALATQMTELHKQALYVWFKICVDAEGSVTSVRARDTESPLLVSAYAPTIQAWKFQPFKLGTQASPVCALQLFLYPRNAHLDDAEELPLPDMMGNEDGLLHVSSEITHRIVGKPAIQPDDADKTRIGRSRQVRIEGVVEFCIDEHGAVFQTMVVEPTGLPSYDKKIADTVKTWRYQPVLIAGVATRVCTGLKLVYTQ